MAGWTSDYDPSGNKTFERHLHAGCRSFLYYVPPPGQSTPQSAYDSADRLLWFQRGLLDAGDLTSALPAL